MKKSPQDIAQEMLLTGMVEETSFDDLLCILRAADDSYYNKDGESFISDEEYDTLRRFAQGLDPNHSYFLGVGSEVRGGKVKLPHPMGSLDQIYEGEIADWIGNWSLQDNFMVLTDKLDGTSAQILYDEDGNLQIAFSRGDGIRGADITRHIRNFESVPKNVGKKMAVRGEVIIKKDNWEQVKSIATTKAKTPYKNLRNCTAGLMNSETINHQLYSLVDFVAYEIIGDQHSKQEMLADLQKFGFSVPYYDTMYRGQYLTDSVLATYLEHRRKKTIYEIDGLVVDVDDSLKRHQMNPTRETLNPAFSIKYKVADASNVAIATVEGVEWNVSKSGYLKPRVRINPVDLVGVTITYATGFNAKFIKDNMIGPGAKIQICRAGDVIPFIQKVIEGTEAQMPEVDWIWNETEVDAILVDHETHEEVIIQQALEFFRTIEAPYLKEGNIRKMFEEHNYNSFEMAVTSMLNYGEGHWMYNIGQNGLKIHNGLREIKNGISLYKLMGATPFFGRGVGVRKFKKLLKDLQVKSVDELPLLNKAQIIAVEGFEDKTATKIVAGMDDYITFMNGINDLTVNWEMDNMSGELEGKKFCFTGFRSKELQAQIEAAGGEVSSSVSRKTSYVVSKTPDKITGKVKKAVELDIPIIGIEDLEQMI